MSNISSGTIQSDGSEHVSSSTVDDAIQDDNIPSTTETVPKKSSTIDLKNLDLFPKLPTTDPSRPLPAWRRAPAPSTPPTTTAASKANNLQSSGGGGGGGGRKTSLGRVTERLEIAASMQAKLPATGKGSAGDLLKQISLKTQVAIELSTNRHGGVTTYLMTGKPEAAKLARKEVLQALGLQVTYVVLMPISVRPHLFGSGGKNLKDITSRHGVRIDVPKLDAAAAAASAAGDSVTGLEEGEQSITITGDFEGAKAAKEEIEALVIKRANKLSLRVAVDRVYHPFIAGPNNANLEKLEAETAARIHMAPMAPSTPEKEKDKNSDGILLVGTKEAVLAADEKIKEMVEALRRNTQTLSLSVKKRQHRFIIGPKGTALHEILKETGCSVELPAAADPSDQITVRGPSAKLSLALQMVFQKSNELILEDIDIKPLLPKTTDPVLFVKYLFGKQRSELRKIETEYSVTVHQLTPPSSALLSPATTTATSPNDPIVLEVQGKTKADVDAARTLVIDFIRELAGTVLFATVECPKELHGYIIGKGGANISKIKANEPRLFDLILPDADGGLALGDGVDEILLVVRRNRGLAGAFGVHPPKAGKAEAAEAAEVAEAQALARQLGEQILAGVAVQADYVSESVHVPVKFHGRLIGSGGEKLKELLGEQAGEVSIKFPPIPGTSSERQSNGSSNGNSNGNNNSSKKKNASAVTASAIDSDSVLIKGPSKSVAEVKARLITVIAELKHIEVIASYSESLNVPKGLGRKLLSGAGGGGISGDERGSGPGGIGWLIRLVKEAIAVSETMKRAAKMGEAVPTESEISLLRVDLETVGGGGGGADEEKLVLAGPKLAVQHAKRILHERAKFLADQTVVEVKLFDECSAEAKAELTANKSKGGADAESALKRQVLRRIIGKEGKAVKALMEKFSVYIQFPEGSSKRRKGKSNDANDVSEDVVAAEEIDEETVSAVVDGISIIKGSRKDVEAAKSELLTVVNKEVIKSASISFLIPKSVLPQIVGSQGANIKIIKDECDVRVDFIDAEENGDDGQLSVHVVIEGSRQSCQAAKKKIMEFVDELVNTTTEIFRIPNYLHRDIIGSSGSRIKTIIESFGGPEKVKVQFPTRGGSVIGGPDSNDVTLKAHARDMDKLRAAVQSAVNEALSDDKVKHTLIDDSRALSETFVIPKSDLSRILGRGGELIRDMMRTHQVIIWMTDMDENNKASGIEVRVVAGKGLEAKLKDAVLDIKGKLRTTATVAIPIKVLANLAAGGATKDLELSGIYEINKRIRADTNGAVVSEISNSGIQGKADSVLTIRGEAKAMEAAIAFAKTQLEELAIHEAAVQISVEGEVRAHIIGKAGSTINRIRTDSGAKVEISGSSKIGGPVSVVIRGSKISVDKAAEHIRKIVEDQKTRRVQDKARDAARASAAAAATSSQASSLSSVTPARIDDDVSFDAPSSIPGYTGRSTASTKGKKSAVKDASYGVTRVGAATASSSYSAYVSTVDQTDKNSWQDVKKKTKKVEVTEEESAATSTASAKIVPPPEIPAAPVDSAHTIREAEASTKKKKKSASAKVGAAPINTNTAAGSLDSTLAVNSEVTSVTTPISFHNFSLPNARTPAPSPAVGVAPYLPLPSTVLVASAAASAATSNSPVSSSTTTSSTLVTVSPILAKQSSIPVKATSPVHDSSLAQPISSSFESFDDQPEDDGWTTVCKKFKNDGGGSEGIAAAAAAAAASSAAKKKKKNKKKKKKSSANATGVLANGCEEDEDGEDDE